MDFDLTPEETEFRDEVRAWLAENLPPPAERAPDFIMKWWKMMREKRWKWLWRSTRNRVG